MRNLDLSPLFRNSIGFDDRQRLGDATLQGRNNPNGYPPYNIQQMGEDGYQITVALAGFSETDLDVSLKENTLYISGRQPDTGDTAFIHQGIARRAFERSFKLAEHIKVTGADLINGLLKIDLIREIPEEKRFRKIPINAAGIPDQQAA